MYSVPFEYTVKTINFMLRRKDSGIKLRRKTPGKKQHRNIRYNCRAKPGVVVQACTPSLSIREAEAVRSLLF